MTYNGCANPYNDPNGNWCPTEVNNVTAKFESRSGKWGYCSDNCPIDPGINSKYVIKQHSNIEVNVLRSSLNSIETLLSM